MKTLNQRWAAKILKQVEAVAQNYDKTYRQKYGSMSHKLPVLVRSAGLVQALAFVETREEPHRQMLTDLAETLGFENKDALLARSRAAQLSGYMYLTQRVLAALLWYKRFAQSVLGVDAGAEEIGAPEEEMEVTADASAA